MAEEKVSILLEVIDKGSEELKKFEENLKKTETSIASFASGIAKMGAAIGLAAAAGLAAMTKSAIDAADEMGKAAQKVGITTEALSGLAFAAKFSDVSFEELQGGLKKLSVSIQAAQDPTSEMANAFAALGVNTTDASGNIRTADAVFKDIATRFKNAPDDVTKTAIAMQLFGKAGANLIPMLNAGGKEIDALAEKAAELGLIYDKQTTKQAEEFNDTLTMLGVGAGSAGLALAKVLLPTLQLLADSFRDAKKEGSNFNQFAEGVGIVFRSAVKIISTAVATVFAFGKGLGAVGAAIAAVANGDFKGAVEILKMYKEDVDKINTANEEFKKKVDESGESVKKETKATEDNDDARKKAIAWRQKNTTAIDAENKAFEKAYQSLLKEADGYKELTAQQKVQWQIEQNVAGFRTAEHQKRMQQLAAQLDAARRLRAEHQGSTDQDVKMAQSLSAVEKSMYDLLAAQNILFKDGSRMLALNTKGKAAWDALKQEIVDLNIEITALKKNPVENALKIENAQARLKGLTDTLNLGAEEFKDRWIEAAQSVEGVEHRMATFQTYIGGARDRMKELADQADDLETSLRLEKITQEQFTLAMERLNTAKFAEMSSQVTELQKKTAGFAGTLQTTFGDVFLNIMQGNFKDIGTSFKQMLDKMVAEALAAQLAKAIFGDFAKSGSVSGTGGGLLTSLVSSLGGSGWGGLIGSMFRANGGPVTAGQPYIVGERRPEVFVPNVSGTILPNVSAAAGMAPQAANNVTFHVTAMDSRSVLAAMDEIKRPLAEMMNGTNRSYNMKG